MLKYILEPQFDCNLLYVKDFFVIAYKKVITEIHIFRFSQPSNVETSLSMLKIFFLITISV